MIQIIFIAFFALLTSVLGIGWQIGALVGIGIILLAVFSQPRYRR